MATIFFKSCVKGKYRSGLCNPLLLLDVSHCRLHQSFSTKMNTRFLEVPPFIMPNKSKITKQAANNIIITLKEKDMKATTVIIQLIMYTRINSVSKMPLKRPQAEMLRTSVFTTPIPKEIKNVALTTISNADSFSSFAANNDCCSHSAGFSLTLPLYTVKYTRYSNGESLQR